MQTDTQKYVKIITPDPHETEISDPQAPRTKDNALGIDDIGIGEDIKPDDARKPDEIRPDPDRQGMSAGKKSGPKPAAQ
jgi:hypothetical protein